MEIEKHDTFLKLLRRNAGRWGATRVAMRQKKMGIWWPHSWSDYYASVRHFGLGLVALGLEKGDRVSLIGDNAPEGFIGELGIQAVGGVPVGLYTDAVSEELLFFARHTEAAFAIAGDQEQVDKYLDIKDKLPWLKRIIYWDPKGLKHYDDPLLASFRSVIRLGEQYAQEHPALFDRLVDEGKGDDLAIILYTSGTKSLPKGVMLSYDNLLSAVEAVMQIDPWTQDGRVFSHLPLAWVPEQISGVAGALLSGCSVSFAEEPETVNEDIREIGPTLIFYGSRLWESLTSTIQVRISESTFLKRLVYRLCLPVGYRWADLYMEGRTPAGWLKFLFVLSDRVLFRHIRDEMGLSRLRFAWTSGSSLSPSSYRMLIAIGIPLRSHYASSEVPAVCNSGTELRVETVGRPVPGVEVKISEQGEILVRGRPVFKGYYKDPEASREALKDGWFHTGDAGFIDPSGHLVFLDRLSDITEITTGEKVAPQHIESRLRFSPYIRDCIVIADAKKPYVTAIITINFEYVGRWTEMRAIPYTTFAELSQNKEVLDLIRAEISGVNKILPNNTGIRKFVVLHKEFDADEAELTRTRKLKREFIQKSYENLIAAMYDGRDEISVEALVKYRDGRTSKTATTLSIQDTRQRG